MPLQLFAQIRKVDEAQRLVYGRAAEEVVDKADEIMDYASSKPHFVKWSKEVAEDTDGKSLGNVRAMHGKVAAGKLTAIDFNDAEKAIDICAKVVDDAEWTKVLEGVYTGFSMGGNYVGPRVAEKLDGRDVLRYTAAPNEISLVDRPCIPTAKFFEIAKADGSTAKVEFKEAAQADAAAAAAVVDEVAVTGSPEEVVALGKAMNDAKLSIADVIAKINAPATPAAPVLVFADAVNKRYPLDTPEHIRAAWSHFSKTEVIEQAEPEVLKGATAAIKDAWIAKVDDKGPPADAKDAAYALSLAKGLYTCGTLAELLASIEYVLSSVEWEEQYEGDGSDIGNRLSAWLSEGGSILGAMVAEEVAEATGTDGVVVVEVLQLSERTGALNKALEADLAKAGARNSKADQKRIQSLHDNASALGATCDATKHAAAGDLAKVEDLAKADLAKLIAEAVEPLQKLALEQAERIKKLEAQPAPARVSLRAVAKSEDVSGEALPAATPAAQVTDERGVRNEAASLIKAIHQSGGVPYAPPLRK